MEYLYDLYKIEKDILRPYQIELRSLVTDNQNFIQQYSSNTPINFESNSKEEFIKFQQKNSHVFTDLIVKINESD